MDLLNFIWEQNGAKRRAHTEKEKERKGWEVAKEWRREKKTHQQNEWYIDF